METLFGLAEALIANGELNRAEETLRKLPSRTEGGRASISSGVTSTNNAASTRSAVEEYRAAQLIAKRDAGRPPQCRLEPSSLPALDDLEAWKELAASLKRHTDAYKG